MVGKERYFADVLAVSVGGEDPEFPVVGVEPPIEIYELLQLLKSKGVRLLDLNYPDFFFPLADNVGVRDEARPMMVPLVPHIIALKAIEKESHLGGETTPTTNVGIPRA